MKQEIIRKNIVTNQYEHLVKSDNGEQYWSPGLTGNESLVNIINENELPVRINSGSILSYDGISYSNFKFPIVPISGSINIEVTLTDIEQILSSSINTTIATQIQ